MRLTSPQSIRLLFPVALAGYAVFAAAHAGCVKLPRAELSPRPAIAPAHSVAPEGAGARPININRAGADELEKLPGVGPALAARIVEHRERYGPFRRVEHLIAVRGISERRFAEVRPYVTAE